jgi:endonuclease/exonuclease/phosphatase (EEP) superfamily protein YafD
MRLSSCRGSLGMSKIPLWLVGCVASVLTAIGCVEPPLTPVAPTPGAPHFTVMSYNIHLDSASEPTTLAAIGGSDADILALQEVTHDTEAILRERYAAEYPHHLFHPAGGAGGLAVLSRFPLTDRGILPGPGGWHPAWHVEVEMPGLRLQLLNLHLRAVFSAPGVLQSYLDTDRDHLLQIADFAAPLDADLSTVVLGDFNEGPDGVAIDYLEARGFSNILPEFHPGQPTWRFRSIGNQFETTFDHILYDESLKPLNAWVERKGASDHLPVLAHLEPHQW